MLEYVLTDEGSDIIREDLCKRLTEGQVGIVPTDTVYGLVCVADNEQGRQRICEMKKREGNKPMQYLLSNLDNCAWLDVNVNDALRKVADAFWPGALTVVVTNSNGNYVGIRVPNSDFVCSLISDIGKPLTATSANLAGHDPLESLEQHFGDLAGEPDFALLSGKSDHPSSTVIRLHDSGEFEVLREGDITEEQIREVLGK
jgi:L-threonylcarbamoyladenylate synthase